MLSCNVASRDVGSCDVGLFWDYENVNIPTKSMDTYTVCTKLRSFVCRMGRLCERRLYFDSHKTSEINTDRTGFDMSGFTLVDCPTRNKKEVVDKKIIVDVMSFVMERLGKQQPNIIVVLMSSDGDYAYLMNRLRDYGVRTVLVHGPNVHTALIRSADVTESWRYGVLGMAVSEPDAAVVAKPKPLAKTALIALKPKIDNARERFVVFLLAVQQAQRKRAVNTDWREVWAYGSQVAPFYYNTVPNSQKDQRAFKIISADAQSAGFVEQTVRGTAMLMRLTAAGMRAVSTK